MKKTIIAGLLMSCLADITFAMTEINHKGRSYYQSYVLSMEEQGRAGEIEEEVRYADFKSAAVDEKPIMVVDSSSEEQSVNICTSNQLLEFIHDDKDPQAKFNVLADLFIFEASKNVSESEKALFMKNSSYYNPQYILSVLNLTYKSNLICNMNELIYGILIAGRVMASQERKSELIFTAASVNNDLTTVLIVSMLLSSKVNSDQPYWNIDWSRKFNVPVKWLNQEEQLFLKWIGYSCNFSDKELAEAQGIFMCGIFEQKV